MAELQAQRTLVKSPPELWAEVSNPEALGRRLSEFGEIRITTTEPESIVAWEGERASGTIELAKSGWGTKITLTARFAEPEPAAELHEEHGGASPDEHQDEVVHDSASELVSEVAAAPRPQGRRGFFARLRAWVHGETPATGQSPPAAPSLEDSRAVDRPGLLPVTVTTPATQPDPVQPQTSDERSSETLDAERAEKLLATVLDDLGAAHHRPFSRG